MLAEGLEFYYEHVPPLRLLVIVASKCRRELMSIS